MLTTMTLETYALLGRALCIAFVALPVSLLAFELQQCLSPAEGSGQAKAIKPNPKKRSVLIGHVLYTADIAQYSGESINMYIHIGPL